MDFEWDANKNAANLAKHGLSFEDAVEVFEDPLQVTQLAHTIGDEVRLRTIGEVPYATLLVIHTLRHDKEGNPRMRVISARRASRAERKIYDERQRT